MDAPSYNGAPGPEHNPGRSRNEPTPYRCLDCAWTGKGAIAQADHYTLTGHHIVWFYDPRESQIQKVG